VSTLLLPASDPRGAKAVQIATNASQWLKCRDRAGRKFYGVPSQRDANHYYLVSRHSCTCPDFTRGRGRECKHVLACQLWCDLVAEQAVAA